MKNLFVNHEHSVFEEGEEFAHLLVSYYRIYQDSYPEWIHDDWIRSAYRPVKYDRVWFNRFKHYGGKSIKWELLYIMYWEGFHVLKKLKCDYFQFCDFMIYGVPSDLYRLIAPPVDLCRRRWFWGGNWRYGNSFKDSHFRQKQKYQKKDHIKKKVKTEKQTVRENWRIEKKIIKDDRRPNYSRYGCPKWIKRSGNKAHRRWQKDNINQGNYEEVMNFKKLKQLIDPWDWT